MAKTNVSAFDELLDSFSDPSDRQTFEGLASRNPKVKEYGLRQSDYSRKLNEHNEDLTELNQWRDWREKNWDDNQNTTKREIEKANELIRLQAERDELEAKIALGGLGGDMTFEELDSYFEKKGVVTSGVLAEKEKAVNDLIVGTNRAMANAALMVPYLNQKHRDEFGELFDPREFLKEANDKGRFDLAEYYENDFVAQKRQAKLHKDHEDEIARLKAEADDREKKAKEEGREYADRARAMGAGSPTDSEGASMGAFQRSYLGLNKKEEGSGAPEVALGEGGIAAYAAREWVNKGSNGTHAI